MYCNYQHGQNIKKQIMFQIVQDFRLVKNVLISQNQLQQI